jgi:hypothetical protein
MYSKPGLKSFNENLGSKLKKAAKGAFPKRVKVKKKIGLWVG